MKGQLRTVERGPLHGLWELFIREATLRDVMDFKAQHPYVGIVSFDTTSDVSELLPHFLRKNGIMTRYYLYDHDRESLDSLPRYFTEMQSVRITTVNVEWFPIACTEFIYRAKLPLEAVPLTSNDAWRMLDVMKKPKSPTDYMDFTARFPNWRIQGPGMPKVEL